MIIGYERVSLRQGQKLDLQTDALQAAGCGEIFSDRQSGADWSREGLKRCLEALSPGDTLVVWKLDRLGRSLRELLELVEGLQKRGVQLRSLKDSIDTSSPAGRLVFHVFAAIAEFERAVLKERIRAGLDAARRRGRKGGRKFKLPIDEQTFCLIRDLYENPNLTIAYQCRTLGVSRKTFWRYLKLAGVERRNHEGNGILSRVG